jgi:phosphoribosylglycinamide formyltransferase-1
MMNVGVLASGSGSNFQALVQALATDEHARVVSLVCNVPAAPVLERAQRLGVPAALIDHRQWADRDAYDGAVIAELQRRGVELVCLAGYMRLVTPRVLAAFPRRVVNIHPTLLPAFPGLHGIRQTLAAGVKVAGCTIHFVDEGADTGPIIAQAAVPVLPGDDEATLAERIQQQEHRLLPAVVKAMARGELWLEGRSVRSKEWIG